MCGYSSGRVKRMGGLEKKPGGTSLVHETLAPRGAPTNVGKRTLTEQLSPAVQAKPVGSGVPATLADAGGSSLGDRVGVDGGSVRVHEDGVAEGMGARAVTMGRDLHFAKGE